MLQWPDPAVLLIYDSIIAFTQIIAAIFIALYIWRLPNKTAATCWFGVFFTGIAAVALAFFLEVSLLAYGDLCFPLRVVAANCAQLGLVQFAYHFPQNDRPGAARLTLGFFLLLLLLTGGAGIAYMLQAHGDLPQAAPLSFGLLTILLPLGLLAAIAVLLRQAWQRRRQAPGSRPAIALRNFGLVLLFGFVPASVPLLQSTGTIAAPVTSYLVGVGILMVMLALFLVFLNYVYAASSFLVRIFSVALVLLLALFGVVTLLMTGARNEQFRATRRWQLSSVQETLRNGELRNPPDELAYVAEMAMLAVDDGGPPFHQRYPPETMPLDFSFITIEDELRRSNTTDLNHSRLRSLSYLRELTSLPGTVSLLRYADQPLNSVPRYVGYQFNDGGRRYEIGFRLADDIAYINRKNSEVILLLLAASLLLWLALRLFLHANLGRPLNALLAGIRRADASRLHEELPVQYEDEIGFLTQSFNTMISSIQIAQMDLREANSLLEERVRQRTAALLQEMQALQQANRQVDEQQQALLMLRERERLARELHDNLGQVLGFVNTQAQAAHQAMANGQPEQAGTMLQQIAAVSRQVLVDIREYILGVQIGSMLQPADLDLAPASTFAASLETYLGEFEQLAGIQTTLRIPTALHEARFAPAIETHLLRIVQEALSNVRKHAGASYAEIRIQAPPPDLSEPDEPERVLVLTISDNGQGFQSARQAGSKPQYGGGFGLNSMRGRAREIGGSIEIDSTPGAGSRITVRVPLRRQSDISYSGLRLLLVDDNELFLRGLHNLLSVNGFEVIGTASNGRQALEQARTLQPDIILMDVQMPELDGLAATATISAELPETHIVMLTVSDDDSHIFEAIKAGAMGYLLKSLESSQLCTMLRDLMQGTPPLSPGVAARVLQAFAAQSQEAPDAEAATEPDETGLTALQIDILSQVAQGRTYREVAERHGYSEVTIKRYMSLIVKQLQLQNRSEAIDYAHERMQRGDWKKS